MRWWSLKKELFAYFFITSTVILLFLGIVFYFVMHKTIYDRVQNDQKLFLENQLQLVDSNLTLLENLIIQVSTDEDLHTLMQENQEPQNKLNEVSERFYAKLDNYLQPIEKYVSVLHIEGNNGLKIRKGFESYLIDRNDYENTEWFKNSMETSGAVCWWKMQENYTRVPHVWIAAPTEYIVPIYKKICRSGDLEILGDMVVFVSPSLFFGEEYQYTLDPNTQIYLVDENGQIVYSDDQDCINGTAENAVNICDLVDFPIHMSDAKQTRTEMADGKLIVYRQSDITELSLVRVIELEKVVREASHFLYMVGALAVVLIVLSFALSLIFSSSFTRPIEEVIKKIQYIAEGNFDYRHDIGPGGKKFELLYQNLYKMENDIKKMIEENRRKEKEKRRLELSMLQMQINPHFLYNTLSSIKWMAVFQRAKGIESMVNSLGIVLQASYSKMDEFVTLDEELDILGHYLNIQKIRYQGKIQMNLICKNQQLLSCYVPRFILQPVVENAVFHGIAPKDGEGEIKIIIAEEPGNLKITVEDNGVGMDETVLENVLKRSKGERQGHIGLANVHSRIRLIYGSEYGVHVESLKGKYTKVRIIMPKQSKGDCLRDESVGSG